MKAAFILSFFTIIFYTSCSETALPEDKNAVVYTGDFAGTPIELSLLQLSDSNVKGYSNHKGKINELSGRLTASPKGYVYKLKELGTSRFSGTFDFELDTAIHMIFGSWQMGDTSGSREVILYTLLPKLAQ